MMKDREKHIVVYDDICILCTWSIRYIIEHDAEGKFYFASLSDKNIKTYLESGMKALDSESVILINEFGIYYHSDAALNILSQLTSFWSFLRFLKIIPRFIRDAIYKMIARYRYKIWGKLEQCWLPPDEEKYRFDYKNILLEISDLK